MGQILNNKLKSDSVVKEVEIRKEVECISCEMIKNLKEKNEEYIPCKVTDWTTPDISTEFYTPTNTLSLSQSDISLFIEYLGKTFNINNLYNDNQILMGKTFIDSIFNEVNDLLVLQFNYLIHLFGIYSGVRNVFGGLLLIVFLLIAVAYYTLAERKIMASMQRRVGPNVVGFWGLLQPLADGLKLLLKEVLIPRKANKFLFILAPIITFMLSLLNWAVIPFSTFAGFSEINLGILYLLTISSLGVYGIILAGWSSNSKYAFLGALRSTAQMISYEIAISFILVSILLFVGSFNLMDIIYAQTTCWFFLPLFPLFIIYLVCMLAETNRTPFDLPEAEAELVAGYNIDYSSIMFAMFFLGEYSSMLLMSSLAVILFCGGGFFPILDNYIFNELIFAVKVSFFAVFFIWVRATLPRYRYDQLMSLGWKIFLPFTFGFFVFILGILLFFNCIPYLRKGTSLRYDVLGYNTFSYKEKLDIISKKNHLVVPHQAQYEYCYYPGNLNQLLFKTGSSVKRLDLLSLFFNIEITYFYNYFRETSFNPVIYNMLTDKELLWLKTYEFGQLYYKYTFPINLSNRDRGVYYHMHIRDWQNENGPRIDYYHSVIIDDFYNYRYLRK